jgi:pyruvate formate lyase activating enzyme
MSGVVREAMLQERLSGKVRCHVCERRCLIVKGGLGWCRTRANRDGSLLTLIYGAISSLEPNPIEKKPFYHFHPGTRALTMGSWSCNFGCPWCQNWRISKVAPPEWGNYLSPEDFVALAVEGRCEGTSISFNEPTLSLEWSLDVFRQAQAAGMYNTFVTNGYMTPEALDLLIDAGLDAMNVDIKGDAAAVRRHARGIDVEKIWSICRLAAQRRIHLEITTLVIPTVNDTDETLSGIADRIARDLGRSVPWHVSAYRPAYKFGAPPTPLEALERAWRLGRDAGLDFVYAGNVADDRHGDTHCPTCGARLVRRVGFHVVFNSIRNGACPECGGAVAGVW